MAPGDGRRRRLEVITAKMRSIGRAVFPMRHEYMASTSPGSRLVAIASLQVMPDYEALSWLVERIQKERPFVGYHAAVALLMAARDSAAASHRDELIATLAKVEAIRGSLHSDTDRNKVLKDFEDLVTRLSNNGASSVGRQAGPVAARSRVRGRRGPA